METIFKKGDFKIYFNGSNTYFVVDNTGHCWKYFKREKSAIKYIERIS